MDLQDLHSPALSISGKFSPCLLQGPATAITSNFPPTLPRPFPITPIAPPLTKFPALGHFEPIHQRRMVFVRYSPAIKVAAIRMVIQGHSADFICNALGESISRQSFSRWLELFQQTRCVIRNPTDYERLGRPGLLTSEDIQFMIKLVEDEPSLFLDEIRERLYDYHDEAPLLSIEAIHQNLVLKLSITLKKPSTVNIRKCIVAKCLYIEHMRFVPAEFLVFSAICDRDLLRTFARSPKGTPSARYIVNQNPERISVLPAISISGVIALALTDNTFNAKKWEDFLEWDLIPRMNPYPGPNSILVCDNAKIHKGSRVEQICIDAGIMIKYLPTYTPELNPIELCFSALK